MFHKLSYKQTGSPPVWWGLLDYPNFNLFRNIFNLILTIIIAIIIHIIIHYPPTPPHCLGSLAGICFLHGIDPCSLFFLFYIVFVLCFHCSIAHVFIIVFIQVSQQPFSLGICIIWLAKAMNLKWNMLFSHRQHMSMRFPQLPSPSIITCVHLIDALSSAYSTYCNIYLNKCRVGSNECI